MFRVSLSPIFRSTKQWYPKHAEQSSDKINSVTCASCWDFCIRILLRCTDPCILNIGVYFIQFCNTCFDILPKVGIGSPTWSSFGSKVPNTFLRRCQSHNSLFSLQPSTIPAYAGCSRWIWTNLFWTHLLLQRAAYLCQWWCCLAYRPSYKNRGFIIPTTNNRWRFNS